MYPYINFLGRQIPSFGLMMVLGILISTTIAGVLAKKKNLSIDDLIIIVTLCMSFALVGAKLVYIGVTFSWHQLVHLIQTGNSHVLLGSGLVFYGGLIGGLVGLYVCHKFFKIEVLSFETVIIPLVPLGHAIGRVGCFLAGCCRGRIYAGFFAVTYPETSLSQDLGHSHHSYFPIQLLESFFNVAIFLILMVYVKRKPKPYRTLLLYIGLYSVVRFLLEFYRGDDVRGLYGFFSTSQWIAIVLMGLVLLAYKFIKNKT